jgi:hypothetical protein
MKRSEFRADFRDQLVFVARDRGCLNKLFQVVCGVSGNGCRLLRLCKCSRGKGCKENGKWPDGGASSLLLSGENHPAFLTL